ncbi:MAG: hypothetical protein V3R33_02300 [Anaerolineales bacterium]
MRIKVLKEQIKELKKNLPEVSIRLAMMMPVDDLEEDLDRMGDELKGEDRAPA